MFLKFVAFALCISFVVCEEYVPAVICNNTQTYSSNPRMEVSGCLSSHERCSLIRGTNHTVIFTFQPNEEFLGRTDFRVYGVFEKFSVPYGKKANACSGAKTSDDGTECNTLGGFILNREYKHTSQFSVSNNYPKIQLSVRFVMYDRRSKKNMMCLEVPVEIMDPPTAENEA